MCAYRIDTIMQTSLKKEPIAKSFKLYPSAVEAIEKLNRKYSGFKKQDLLSSLIVQAVAQYIELEDSNEV